MNGQAVLVSFGAEQSVFHLLGLRNKKNREAKRKGTLRQPLSGY